MSYKKNTIPIDLYKSPILFGNIDRSHETTMVIDCTRTDNNPIYISKCIRQLARPTIFLKHENIKQNKNRSFEQIKRPIFEQKKGQDIDYLGLFNIFQRND